MAHQELQLAEYYAKRAREYERIYDKPERQRDLETLKHLCREIFEGRHVFEIACGTGYWTEVVARSAASIVATDINDCPIEFRRQDAFELGTLAEKHFTAGFAAAWWSHLRKADIGTFLRQFHRVFSDGTLVAFMDNRFVAGSNLPISRTDANGDTYQQRRLDNGEQFEVLKNFPSEPEIHAVLAGLATDIRWTELEYYWFLTYRMK